MATLVSPPLSPREEGRFREYVRNTKVLVKMLSCLRFVGKLPKDQEEFTQYWYVRASTKNNLDKRSKAAVTARDFPNPGDYTIIAPKFESPDSYLEFEMETDVKDPHIKTVTFRLFPVTRKLISTLEKKNISATYGRWLVKGSPRVLLLVLFFTPSL